MQYIRSNGHILGADDDGFSFSWDDKRPGTKILLSKVPSVYFQLKFPVDRIFRYTYILIEKKTKHFFIN